jgi:hypothetical protein
MTSPLGQYGAKGYEGPESRTLGKFAADKFSYREQAKNIIQLNNAVGYMSGMMRKMQRGIDEANQNFVQQIQAMINDFLVLLGGPAGGGDTGFEFGDLKYVLMAIGALFGFGNEDGEITLPINLFAAAWHFFSSYILPVQNFTDAINMIIDSAIAAVLDIFGEVPILGQALEQLAVIISDIRDLLTPVAESLETLLNSFLGVELGDLPGIAIFGETFKPILDAFEHALQGIGLPDFSAVFHIIAGWTIPFVEAIAAAIDSLTFIVNVVQGNEDLSNLPDVLLNIFSPLDSLNLFNIVPIDLLAQIPLANIGPSTTNLITDPGFTNPESISGAGQWTHDATQGHSVPLGTAKIVADGTGAKELLSNLIPVSEGQKLPISGWIKYTGLVCPDGVQPIELGITGYITGSDVTQKTAIMQQGKVPPTSDWRQLSGTYTVPANVTGIRVRLTISSTATAGTVWWDDLSATKSGLLPQAFTEFLPDDLESLGSDVQTALTNLIQKVEQADFNALLSTLGGDLTAIANRLNSFLNGLSPLNANNINAGNVADQFVQGLSTINNNIVQNVLNVFDQSFPGHTDVANAFHAQRLSLTEVSSRVLLLENTFTGGIADQDDFERIGSTLGPGWLVLYGSGNGTVGTPDGHHASFQNNGVADREFVAIRTTTTGGHDKSSTDLQRTGMALAAKSESFFGYCGHHDLWCRISDDTTTLANITGIRMRFGGDGSCSIDRFVSGIRTRLAEILAGGTTPAGPGAVVYADAGLPGIARHFRLVFGMSPILQIPEIGVASGLGGAFRRWGWGGRTEGHLLPLPGQTKWGEIHAWSGKDQVSI